MLRSILVRLSVKEARMLIDVLDVIKVDEPDVEKKLDAMNTIASLKKSIEEAIKNDTTN